MIGFPTKALRALLAASARYLDGARPEVCVEPVVAGACAARLYRPHEGDGGPPLLFFHGGGFVSCGIETHDGLCRRLAHVSGCRIVSVGYRLAPEHPAPAQLEDAIGACRWALSSPACLGSTDRIFVGKDSAGGYLAARCAAALNLERPGAIAAQLLFYPLVGLDPRGWSAPAWRHARWSGRSTRSIPMQCGWSRRWRRRVLPCRMPAIRGWRMGR